LAVRVSFVAYAVGRVSDDEAGLLLVHQLLHALWIGSISAHQAVASELVNFPELTHWFRREGSVEVVLFGLAESGKDGLQLRSFPEVDVILGKVDPVFVLRQELPEVGEWVSTRRDCQNGLVDDLRAVCVQAECRHPGFRSMRCQLYCVFR